MLGEIIGEMKGNVSGQRVTDIEGPTRNKYIGKWKPKGGTSY